MGQIDSKNRIGRLRFGLHREPSVPSVHLSKPPTVGVLEAQRELTRRVREAQALGNPELAVELAQKKIELAKQCRNTTCRSCQNWNAFDRWCHRLGSPARSVQGCGNHKEVTG